MIILDFVFWKILYSVYSVIQLCLTLCSLMDCSPSGSSVHLSFPAIILEWVAISYSRYCIELILILWTFHGILCATIWVWRYPLSYKNVCFIMRNSIFLIAVGLLRLSISYRMSCNRLHFLKNWFLSFISSNLSVWSCLSFQCLQAL